MLRTLLRDESNQFRVVDDPSAISDIVENLDRLLWIDIEQPSAAEFATIQEEFNLHPLAIERRDGPPPAAQSGPVSQLLPGDLLLGRHRKPGSR